MAAFLIFCSNCGAQNPANERFCFSCGYGLAISPTAVTLSSTLMGQLPAHTLLKQRYRVLQTIGQGGMGSVYLSQDISLGDRLVAIKEMSQSNSQQAQEAIDNFKREAHLLAGLQHPNLPSIYDYFEENARWYLVMSFIQGETLEDYLSHAPGQRLPLEEALHIGLELCGVLHYLHTHQPSIIFRDLKPGNIMRSADGRVYLIDFGIARHFKPGKAKDTANYGSAGYAPPEQYGKAQTTERSDIYSLGATLYELISGYDPSQTPFRFPPLQSLIPTLPNQLAKLITQMLEMDDNKRPANIKVVQQELQQFNVSASLEAKQYALVPSTSKQPTPLAPNQSVMPRPKLSTPGQQRHIHVQQQPLAKVPPAPARRPPTWRNDSSFVLITHPSLKKFFSACWMLFGVFLILRGILGSFLFSSLRASGLFVQIVDFGFCIFLGLMILLLARTKQSLFPITKLRRTEYMAAGIIGGTATLFGITITIIGEVTSTSTNLNDIGTPLGAILIVMSMITLWITHTRIKKTP